MTKPTLNLMRLAAEELGSSGPSGLLTIVLFAAINATRECPWCGETNGGHTTMRECDGPPEWNRLRYWVDVMLRTRPDLYVDRRHAERVEKMVREDPHFQEAFAALAQHEVDAVRERGPDATAVNASLEALRSTGATGEPRPLDVLVRLGHVIIDLRRSLELSKKKRRALSILLDEKLDSIAAGSGHGEVPGA